MPEQRNLKISVENLGPVREGEFELKPLTIFIGPNNSGKSYMAYLVYLFCRVLSGAREWPLAIIPPVFRQRTQFEKLRKELEEWFRTTYQSEEAEHKYLLFKDLPEGSQQALQEGFRKTLTDSKLRE